MPTTTRNTGPVARARLAAAGVAALDLGGGCRAAEPEVRASAVPIDGKAAGGYTLTTAVDADGGETLTAVASVKARVRRVNSTAESRCV